MKFGSDITSNVYANFEAGGLQVGITKVIDAWREIRKAASLAASYENVICISLNSEWKSEGYDREDMKLPGRTDDLVRAVIQANPNMVVINQSGTLVEMPWLDQCATVLQTWYGGDVLGDTIPCGKLPHSWPAKNEDNHSFLNFRTEKGRVLYGEDVYVGYRYYEKQRRNVAFPFDMAYPIHSLSIKTQKPLLMATTLFYPLKLKILVNILEKRRQKFIYHPWGRPYPLPSKELKAFMKTTLEPGESNVMNFRLQFKEICSYYDEYQKMWCLE